MPYTFYYQRRTCCRRLSSFYCRKGYHPDRLAPSRVAFELGQIRPKCEMHVMDGSDHATMNISPSRRHISTPLRKRNIIGSLSGEDENNTEVREKWKIIAR